MTNYYFLATLCLPPSFDQVPEISFRQLIGYYALNLKPNDFAKVIVLQRFIDLYNMRAFWLKEPFDPRGTFSKDDFQEMDTTRTGLPEYVLDYLHQYEEEKERIKHFPSLISSFFRNEQLSQNDFLRKYLAFEHEWRLVMTLFRSRLYKRDMLDELQFEDMQEPFIAQLVAQKDAKTEEVPEGFEELQKIFNEHAGSPLDLLRAILEFRFNKVESFKDGNPFSIDTLLGNLVQLLLVETWQEAKTKNGTEIIENIVKAAK